LADVVVRRDLFEMEEALGIALALGLLHGLLVSQEGRALGKEDRKGAQANVFHRVRGIGAGAPVGQPAQDLAQMLDVVIPSLEGIAAHPASLRCTSALRALR
jgi:hypothetical protein